MTDLVKGHSTATVYEASKTASALDTGIRSVWFGARVAAPAFTVRGVGGDNLALHHAVLKAPEGSVLVVDLQGAPNGHWGEVLAVAAQQRGIAGLVIDGGVRDTVEMAELGFPVFARHIRVVGTAKDYPGDFEAPVRIGGVTVKNGDIVIGDNDGVIVLPADTLAEAVSKSDERVASEATILEEIRQGRSTLDIYGLK